MTSEEHPPSEHTRRSSLPPVRDAALLLTSAYLYYVEHRSQAEIARQIGVSRSTISRLLAEARQTGVVRIEVAAAPVEDSLERQVADQLGLDRVYAAPGVADEGDPGPILSGVVGQALLDSGLGPGEALLVSWGRTTWSASRTDLPQLRGVAVVPAVGGLNDDAPWFQTNEIARRLAAAIGGHPHLLHAPAMPSKDLRRSLAADAAIRSVLSRWDDAAAILVGVGAWPKTHPHEAPAALSVDREALQRTVGDVGGRFFDSAGNPVTFAAEAKLLALTREQLSRIPKRIAIAVGIRKADAIIAAARSRLINILVTDLVTASAVLTRAASRGRVADQVSP